MIKPCPRCQHPLDIPTPIPEKMQCPKCGAVINYKKKPQGPGEEAPRQPAAAAPPAPAMVAAAASPMPAGAETPRGHTRLEDFQVPFEEMAASFTETPNLIPAVMVPPTPMPGGAPTPAPSIAVAPEVQTPAPRSRSVGSSLPKPVLFGLFGALGGLLGALVLGELLWKMLHPTPTIVEPLKISASPAVTVYPGSPNKIVVKVLRQRFAGPVRLTAVNPPKEVQIPGFTLAAEETDGELHVAALGTGGLGNHLLEVQATALDNQDIKTSDTIRLSVKPVPATLQLTASPTVSVYPGTQNRFGFLIARKLFEGPVRIEVLDLPKGITIPLQLLPEGTTQGEFIVAADPTLKPRGYKLPIRVHAMADHTIAAEQPLQLNIEPPPGKLLLAVSPQVTVFPGTKNKFMASVLRQEFKGAIEVVVEDPPKGVTITKITIPTDKSDGELEVTADKSLSPEATAAPITLRVNAHVVGGGENITATAPLQLSLTPPPPGLQMAVSKKVSVYPGGKATFGVKINRARGAGPVNVFGGGPGVAVTALTIPADKIEGEATLAVDLSQLGLPLPRIVSVPITAQGAPDKKGQVAVGTDQLQVEILPPPSDLSLTVSPEVELYQAGKCQFTLKVARTGFLGPVQYKFNNLPSGVTLTDGVVPGNEIVLAGQATLDAPAKNHEIEVVATGPKAPDGKIPTTTKKFTLNLKPFDPTRRPPLDIVFVLDVSNSMDAQIQGVKNGIGQFVKTLKDRELEARIGMIAFRDINFDENPLQTIKFGGLPFTTDPVAYSTEVGKLKAMGGGDDPESSLDALVEAAKLPYRNNALRILMLITDTPPQIKGNSVKMPVARQFLKERKIDQIHLIVREADRATYQGVQEPGKGGFFDLDKATKDPAGFAGLLPILSKEIVTTIGAPTPVAKLPPQPESAPPPPPPPGEKPPEPRAETNISSPVAQKPQAPVPNQVQPSQVAPPIPPTAAAATPPVAEIPSLQAAQSDQLYEDKDRWVLLMAMALWTGALAAGIAFMLASAQKRYLRGAFLSFGETAKILGLGLLAGCAAGAVSQWFFQYTGGTAFWSTVSRLLAWAILGGLIGAGMSYFIPNVKRQRAFLGGSIGGLIGAIGFALITKYAGEALGRWIGAAVLGLAIGLMVAFAELGFRRYWLEVAFGKREIRTVNLGTATVALGGDESQVSLYVPEAPPRALGYRVDRHKVYCEDFAAGKTTEVAPGDCRDLAAAKIKVCSAASALPTGVTLQLLLSRNLALMEGMPLSPEDIPGLEPQGADGIVALVSQRPSDPKTFLLRNRSRQPWTVTEANGNRRKVESGQSIELTTRSEVDFGQAKGILDPTTASAEPR